LGRALAANRCGLRRCRRCGRRLYDLAPISGDDDADGLDAQIVEQVCSAPCLISLETIERSDDEESVGERCKDGRVTRPEQR